MKLLLCIYSLLLISCSEAAADDSKSDMKDVLLAISGWDGAAEEHLRDTELYDPELNVWRSVSPAPTSLSCGYSATVLNNKVYVCGHNSGSKCFMYDPIRDRWTEIAGEPQSPGLVTADGQIYAVRQSVDERQTTVSHYSQTLDRWTHISNFPYSVMSFGIASVGGSIYVAGGNCLLTDKACYKEVFYRFDIETKSYIKLASLPQLRTDFKLVHVTEADGDYLLAIGGIVELNEFKHTVTDTVDVYHVQSDKWLPDLPDQWKGLKNIDSPIHSFGSAVIKSEDGSQDIYVAGGEDFSLASYSSVVRFRFGNSTEEWQRVKSMERKRSCFNLVTVQIPRNITVQ